MGQILQIYIYMYMKVSYYIYDPPSTGVWLLLSWVHKKQLTVMPPLKYVAGHIRNGSNRPGLSLNPWNPFKKVPQKSSPTTGGEKFMVIWIP